MLYKSGNVSEMTQDLCYYTVSQKNPTFGLL